MVVNAMQNNQSAGTDVRIKFDTLDSFLMNAQSRGVTLRRASSGAVDRSPVSDPFARQNDPLIILAYWDRGEDRHHLRVGSAATALQDGSKQNKDLRRNHPRSDRRGRAGWYEDGDGWSLAAVTSCLHS